MDPDQPEDGARAAWALLLGLLAPLIVGAALTASVFGAVFGVPLLLLVARPWWGAVRVVRGARGVRRSLWLHAVVASTGLSAMLLVAAAVGADDVDGPLDLLGAVAAAGLLALTWFGALGLRRAVVSIDH